MPSNEKEIFILFKGCHPFDFSIIGATALLKIITRFRLKSLP